MRLTRLVRPSCTSTRLTCLEALWVRLATPRRAFYNTDTPHLNRSKILRIKLFAKWLWSFKFRKAELMEKVADAKIGSTPGWVT